MIDHQFFRLLANLLNGLRKKMNQEEKKVADILIDECLMRAGEQQLPFIKK